MQAEAALTPERGNAAGPIAVEDSRMWEWDLTQLPAREPELCGSLHPPRNCSNG